MNLTDRVTRFLKKVIRYPYTPLMVFLTLLLVYAIIHYYKTSLVPFSELLLGFVMLTLTSNKKKGYI